MSVLVAQVRADLTAAMRARERSTVKLLRTVLAAISNAEAQQVHDLGAGSSQASSGRIAGASTGVASSDVDRRELSEDEVREVISAERDERLSAADAMAAAGASDDAALLREEATVLDDYLRPGSSAIL